MDPVEDDDGRRYLVRKRSSDAWLVLDPSTGEETYRDPGDLRPLGVDEASDADRDAADAPLEVAASGVPEHVRRLVLAARTERALGLATTVVDRGPVGVRTLLAETTLCESDLYGLLAEFTAADLIEETDVAGERAYVPTDDGVAAVERLRSGVESSVE